jgi:hypothetical protein
MQMDDADGMPKVGLSGRRLGARPGRGFGTDIEIDEKGRVHPATGGISVAPDDPMNLHELRRPRSLPGGHGKDPVWCIQVQNLGEDLVY